MPVFLPKCCMVRLTGMTLQAVPKIISAMGAVDQSGEGAKRLPARVPAKCISGNVEPATALLKLNTQAFLNVLEKMVLIKNSLIGVAVKPECHLWQRNHNRIIGVVRYLYASERLEVLYNRFL